MLKLIKGQQPNVLTRNATQWLADLMVFINNNQKPTSDVYNKYNHDEVKNALKLECREKCMYCESIVNHVAYEHIEHIKPKAINKFPHFTFSWDNLGWACPRCNINKGDKYDPNLPIINPYIDNPDDDLIFAGGLVIHKAGSRKGEVTIEHLQLNRTELLEMRKEKIQNITNLVDKYCRENPGALKEIYKKQILDEMEPSKEFSRIVVEIVKALVPGGLN